MAIDPVSVTFYAALAATAGFTANSVYSSHCRYKLEEFKEKINSDERISKHKLELESQERLIKDNPELYKIREEMMHERKMQEDRLAYFKEKAEKERQMMIDLAQMNVAGSTINRLIDKYFNSHFGDDSPGGLSSKGA